MEGETASISFKVSTTESTVWEFTDVVPSKIKRKLVNAGVMC